MDAIHRTGKISYFNGKGRMDKHTALRQHLNYIMRKGSLVFGDPNQIVEDAKRCDTRWDARIALKFFIALPQDTNSDNVHTWINDLKTIISDTLKINKSKILMTYHTDGELRGDNPHVHVVAPPLDKGGKKLRITPKDLENFHQAIDKLLTSKGYNIKKGEGINIPRWRLENPRIRKDYLQYKELKQRMKNYNEPEVTRQDTKSEPHGSWNNPWNDWLDEIEELRRKLKNEEPPVIADKAEETDAPVAKTEDTQNTKEEEETEDKDKTPIKIPIDTPTAKTEDTQSTKERKEIEDKKETPIIISINTPVEPEPSNTEKKQMEENTVLKGNTINTNDEVETKTKTQAEPEIDRNSQTKYDPYLVQKLFEDMMRQENKMNNGDNNQRKHTIFTSVDGGSGEDTPKLRR